MNTTVRIRPAIKRDIVSVTALLDECGLPVDGLSDQFGEGYCIAVDEEKIVGAGGIEIYGDYGLLRSVAVSPQKQGHGIGNMIAENRVTWAMANGVHNIYLLTTTAQTFFEKRGFAAVQRDAVPDEIRQSSEFSTICPASAAVMHFVHSAKT